MRSRLKRRLLFLLVFLVALMVGVRIAIPLLARSFAVPAISRELQTEFSLQNLRLGLLRGFVGLHGISIQQPTGFDEDPPLLQIGNLSVDLAVSDLLRGKFRVQEAAIDKLALHVVRNADGRLNLSQVGPARQPDADAAEDTPASAPSPLMLDHVTIQEAIVSYSDFSVQPPVAIALTNLNLELTHLPFDVGQAGAATNMPGKLLITAGLSQPGYSNGYFGVCASIGALGTNIPPVNAALRVVGFNLGTVSGMLRAGVPAAMGGSVLDLVVDASVAEDWLRANIEMITAGNTMRMGVGGTPQRPMVDKSTALYNLLSRPTALLAKTASGFADAGVTAGKTVVSSAGKVGGGLLGGLANIVRGATDVGQGAARGDMREMGDAFFDMTAGTVTGAVGSASETARGAVEGVGRMMSDATGQTQRHDWQADVHARWLTHWQEAQDFTARSPVPGMTIPSDLP
jgi:hypothetical protein